MGDLTIRNSGSLRIMMGIVHGDSSWVHWQSNPQWKQRGLAPIISFTVSTTFRFTVKLGGSFLNGMVLDGVSLDPFNSRGLGPFGIVKGCCKHLGMGPLADSVQLPYFIG